MNGSLPKASESPLRGSECAAILLPSSQVDTSLDPDGLVTVAPTRRNTTRPATTSRAAGGGGAPVFDGSDGSLEEAAGRDQTTTQRPGGP